jgi:hypothetical protein
VTLAFSLRRGRHYRSCRTASDDYVVVGWPVRFAPVTCGHGPASGISAAPQTWTSAAAISPVAGRLCASLSSVRREARALRQVATM